MSAYRLRLWPALLALAAVVLSSTSSLALDLYCAWPQNPCCDTRIRVDEQRGLVTYEFGGRRYGPLAASVSRQRVQWATNFGTPTQWTIDRVTGVLLQYETVGNVSYDPMPCRLESEAPKW